MRFSLLVLLTIFSLEAFATESKIYLDCSDREYNITLKGILDLTNKKSELIAGVGYGSQREEMNSPKVLNEGASKLGERMFNFFGNFSGGRFEADIVINTKTKEVKYIRVFNHLLGCR
ncbi:MAG: hypothetical protein AB7I27_01045 [Bacteriovoracaceae bacterium]